MKPIYNQRFSYGQLVGGGHSLDGLKKALLILGWVLVLACVVLALTTWLLAENLRKDIDEFARDVIKRSLQLVAKQNENKDNTGGDNTGGDNTGGDNTGGDK